MRWTKPSHVGMLLLFSLQGCSIYSFMGNALLPPATKTFSIQWQSDISSGPPDLAGKFQQRLGDILAQYTRLQQVSEHGDLQLHGTIQRFSYVGLAPTKDVQTGKQKAAIVRLKIEVSLTYTNRYAADTNFNDQTFVQYADVSASAYPGHEESALVDEVLTKLVEDILYTTVAQW